MSQEWGLLTTQASLTVRAGVIVGGACLNPAFPAWFGKNSTTTKSKRLAGELALHLGARISGGRDAVRRDYLGMLTKYVTAPLAGGDVEETIRRLDVYGLSRDDLFETLPDLALRVGGVKEKTAIDALDTKAKTHFTKTYKR